MTKILNFPSPPADEMMIRLGMLTDQLSKAPPDDVFFAQLQNETGEVVMGCLVLNEIALRLMEIATNAAQNQIDKLHKGSLLCE